MTPRGVSRVVPPVTRGVDALVPFTGDQLDSLIARYAIKAVGAYVEVLVKYPNYADLLFSKDLIIAPYTEAPVGPVTAALGTTLGASSVTHAQALGIPVGNDLLIDFEDITGDALGYVDARADGYALGGYGSLLYVGLPLPATVTPTTLQALRPARYMRSCSLAAPEPTTRKWCVIQHSPGNYLDPVLNVRVDHFTVEQDALGGLPVWWWAK